MSTPPPPSPVLSNENRKQYMWLSEITESFMTEKNNAHDKDLADKLPKNPKAAVPMTFVSKRQVVTPITERVLERIVREQEALVRRDAILRKKLAQKKEKEETERLMTRKQLKKAKMLAKKNPPKEEKQGKKKRKPCEPPGKRAMKRQRREEKKVCR